MTEREKGCSDMNSMTMNRASLRYILPHETEWIAGLFGI